MKMQQAHAKSFLIFGGNSRLAKIFFSQFPNDTILIPKSVCDIRKKESIERVLIKNKSQYIINCAAITDIELCEQKPRLCFETNIIGLHNLQEICNKYNRKLIHISSNYALNPKNNYGLSKYIGEKIIDQNNLIIRTSFYDKDTYIIKNLLTNKPVNAYSNMYINPVSIYNLIQEIYRSKDKTGVQNIFSDKKISWYQFACCFCEVFNMNKNLIKKTLFKKQAYKA